MSNPTPLPSQFTALITGASAGLGAEFARQLAPAAGTLILVARRLERLEVLKEELTLLHPQLRVVLFQLDLAEPQSVPGLVEVLRDKKLPVDYLVNNAGLGDLGTFESSDWTRVQAMLRVNIEALTALTHALVPGMIARKQGVILNVASTAGFLPLPTFTVYAATKAYVCSFSEALAAELSVHGIIVTALCPGPVSTEFGEVATRPNSARKFAPVEALYVPAEEVVRQALDAARRGQHRVIPGALVKAGALLLEILPVPLIRALYRIASKFSPLSN